MSELEEVEVRDVNKSHDQYCQYENLPRLLKRFSFQEKMSIATICSSEAILFARTKEEKAKGSGALPWCMETFVMLAMEATEYFDGDFQGKNYNKFVKMYNAIWEASEIVARTPCGRFDFIDRFLAVTALNQFTVQESPWIRQYRFWRVFNDDSVPVCLKSIFKEKMGVEYEDFLMLGALLQVLFIAQSQSKITIPQKILTHLLLERYPVAAEKLMISRADYVKLQKKYVKDLSDPYKYVYSLCPSCQYPFVTVGDTIYFPLPHLLTESVTSSLFFRLTEGDDNLRSSIGKHTWENYVYELIAETGVYDEFFPEQLYTYKGSASRSPDVLARHGNDVLFIDSKSTVPSLGIRLMDEDAFESNIKIVSENIVKLYNQMQRFQKYNPFIERVGDWDCFWGIVMVLEDSYIMRKHYYESAAKALRIEQDSKEWQWLITHIKVIRLYDIEKVSLKSCSLIDACKEAFGDDPFNHGFGAYPGAEMKMNNKRYRAFRKKFDEKVHAVVVEMGTMGLYT